MGYIRMVISIRRKIFLPIRSCSTVLHRHRWIIVVMWLVLGALTGYLADRSFHYRVDYWFPFGSVYFDALPPWNVEGSWASVVSKTTLGYYPMPVGLDELASDRQKLLVFIRRLFIGLRSRRSERRETVFRALRSARYLLPGLVQKGLVDMSPRPLFLIVAVRSFAENKQLRDAARSTWLLPFYSASRSKSSFIAYTFVIGEPESADFRRKLRTEEREHGDVTVCSNNYLGQQSTLHLACALNDIYQRFTLQYIILTSDNTFVDLPKSVLWLAAKQQYFLCDTGQSDVWSGGMVMSEMLAEKVHRAMNTHNNHLVMKNRSAKDLILAVARSLMDLPTAEICPNGIQRASKLPCTGITPLFLLSQTAESLFALAQRLAVNSSYCPEKQVDQTASLDLVSIFWKYVGYVDLKKSRS